MLVTNMKEVKKPWGSFKQFVLNKKCTVKIIEVKSNGILSLQKHKKREEEWYFLTDGFVQLGDKIRKLKKGSLIKIPKNTAHRLLARNKQVAVLEISFGKFSEKDITRLKDKYGRK